MELVTWGREECARLCEYILNENTGIAQQIIENRHDLLDLMTVEQLSAPDDLGLTPQFLCVYYDKPEAVRYLHSRGVDFVKVCDPMGFGTPMYYAVAFSRYSMIRVLESIGVSVVIACDCLGYTPTFHAERLDDRAIKQLIARLLDKKGRAIQMVRKNLWKRRATKHLVVQKKAIRVMQRIIRGFLGRRRFKRKALQRKMRQQFGAAAVDDDEDTVYSSDNRSQSSQDTRNSNARARRGSRDSLPNKKDKGRRRSSVNSKTSIGSAPQTPRTMASPRVAETKPEPKHAGGKKSVAGSLGRAAPHHSDDEGADDEQDEAGDEFNAGAALMERSAERLLQEYDDEDDE
jgi:ankyrin repeat protein